jgi:hypothetical protein
VDALSVLDVAPLVLHSLGLPVGVELEGRVPTELFDPAWLAACPVRRETTVVAFEAPTAAAVPAFGDDPAGEAAVFERLRSLGYLE